VSIRSASTIEDGATLRTEVAIVGAGAAGIALALRLGASGIDCLLLEAGGREESDLARDDYEGTIVQPEHHRLQGLTDSRLRVLGGSTNHWEGWSRPLLPEVFTHRPWIADIGWPFGPSDLEADYRWASEVVELGEPVFDAERLGMRTGHPSPFEGDPVLDLPGWRFSPPTRFGQAYGPALEDGPVDVVLDAALVRGEVVAGRVASLEFARTDGAAGSFRVGAEHVVLATGGIENVRQLLLLARRHPEAGLDGSGWLGRGWMEHPHSRIAQVVGLGEDLDLALHLDGAMDGATAVRVGLGLRADVREEDRLMAASLTIEEAGDLEVEVAGDLGLPALARTLGRGARVHQLYARTEQRPRAANRIELSSTTDRFGNPLPEVHWALGEDDVRDLRRTMEHVATRIVDLGLGFVSDRGTPSERARVRGGSHHMGGARMHEDPSSGVVDPVGRVHAIPNLWIAGSAVFPTGCFSNPTLTILALVSRMATALGAPA
jgi:choline dehydrogenase-like flavoprotein